MPQNYIEIHNNLRDLRERLTYFSEGDTDEKTALLILCDKVREQLAAI